MMLVAEMHDAILGCIFSNDSHFNCRPSAWMWRPMWPRIFHPTTRLMYLQWHLWHLHPKRHLWHLHPKHPWRRTRWSSMIFNLCSVSGIFSNGKPEQKRCRPWVLFLMFHRKGRDWNKRIRWLVSQTLWEAWMQDRFLRHCQNFGQHALQRVAVSCGHVISLWVSACNKDCHGLDTLRW